MHQTYRYKDGRLFAEEKHPADAYDSPDFDAAMQAAGYTHGADDCSAWSVVSLYENAKSETCPWIISVSPCGCAQFDILIESLEDLFGAMNMLRGMLQFSLAGMLDYYLSEDEKRKDP